MSEKKVYLAMLASYLIVAGIISGVTHKHGTDFYPGVLVFSGIIVVALLVVGVALAPAFALLGVLFSKAKAPVWLVGLNDHYGKITGGKSTDTGSINSILTVGIMFVFSCVLISLGSGSWGVVEVTVIGIVALAAVLGACIPLFLGFGSFLNKRKAPFICADIAAREKEQFSDAKPAEAMQLVDTTVVATFLGVAISAIFIILAVNVDSIAGTKHVAAASVEEEAGIEAPAEADAVEIAAPGAAEAVAGAKKEEVKKEEAK